ncbi:hypothetical protein P170DRAFT_470285 [Aspergillus steynii IBT 23096]|uniref:Uncharacterized protein n=1 Tax=Aspergillus steynii IBT 23096 TaxID=1392250 RepID=A0A2I2GPP6_9EURO|nr:uncharacterized protein P170DRAFT_470285 [Aspergillus steynii IBT 23096]PLB54851.1 hypothetical protein P170DRAFT_470285 [Aspergillus steynii IBT 23096]
MAIPALAARIAETTASNVGSSGMESWKNQLRDIRNPEPQLVEVDEVVGGQIGRPTRRHWKNRRGDWFRQAEALRMPLHPQMDFFTETRQARRHAQLIPFASPSIPTSSPPSMSSVDDDRSSGRHEARKRPNVQGSSCVSPNHQPHRIRDKSNDGRQKFRRRRWSDSIMTPDCSPMSVTHRSASCARWKLRRVWAF